jgi:hypothetical protein
LSLDELPGAPDQIDPMTERLCGRSTGNAKSFEFFQFFRRKIIHTHRRPDDSQDRSLVTQKVSMVRSAGFALDKPIQRLFKRDRRSLTEISFRMRLRSQLGLDLFGGLAAGCPR